MSNPAPPRSTERDRRVPRAVYSRGTEPDPRFSMANERTFLAWIRTSLALLAGGVGVEALTVPIAAGPRQVIALILIALGVVAAVHAGLGWARSERAMREGRPLPSPAVGVVLAVGVIACALILATSLGS